LGEGAVRSAEENSQPAAADDSPSNGSRKPVENSDEPAAAAPPSTVEIPAIDVRADLVGLGLNDDGSMEVPDFGLAGWYIGGPPPGAKGPAVIAAHYDSTDGPDVFYRLAELEIGDEIRVHRTDGGTATFVVEEVEQRPKDELPGDRIWAAADRPRLTLITCGGTFDRSIGHYTDNVIVYAAAG